MTLSKQRLNTCGVGEPNVCESEQAEYAKEMIVATKTHLELLSNQAMKVVGVGFGFE
jgi:hypothetical protein